MARTRRDDGSQAVTRVAETIGKALGQVAARLDEWKKQRAQIAADLQRIVSAGAAMLREIGHEAGATKSGFVDPQQRRKGGRPKGYKMSEATKRKLRQAWKRRKARAKTGAAEKA